MARGKKTTAVLTPEEKLQQALVPIEEQPYKIPENWCWTTLNVVADWGSGGTPSRKKQEYYNGAIPWVKTGELNDGYVYDTEEKITEDAVLHSSAKLFPKNTIAIAMYGATIGKVGILGMEATTNQACACAVSSAALDYKYLFYYALSQKDAFIRKAKGGAQPNISQEIIKGHIIPLPPLAEQQRIVEQIESIFAKLDDAKEKAQTVVDGFELRKSAILHKAFTGELTAQWRQEHGVGLDSWEKKNVGDVLKIVKDKYDPSKDELLDIPYIGLEHIEKGNGIISHGTPDDVKSIKTLFKCGDVLYGKLRPYLDKHDVVDFEGMCSTDILVYRSDRKETAAWFNYLLGTTAFIDYANSNSSGINLPRTSEKVVSAYSILVPLVEEQSVIVFTLDRILGKERQAKEAAETVIDQIDTMKKAVLARAFRGELGTNDPAEESAMELLKSVL